MPCPLPPTQNDFKWCWVCFMLAHSRCRYLYNFVQGKCLDWSCTHKVYSFTLLTHIQHLLSCAIGLRRPNMRRILSAWMEANVLLRHPWCERRIRCSVVFLMRLNENLASNPQKKPLILLIESFNADSLSHFIFRRRPTPPKMVVKSLRLMVLQKLSWFIFY